MTRLTSMKGEKYQYVEMTFVSFPKPPSDLKTEFNSMEVFLGLVGFLNPLHSLKEKVD